MKAYTDLEQSKKLAEFLSLESADMHYSRVKDEEHDWIPLLSPIPKLCAEYIENIPCWSLSALLDLLPKGEDTIIDLCFGGYKGEEYIDEWFCNFEGNKEPFEYHSCSNKDKLDVTLEMVVWLKENNKL